MRVVQINTVANRRNAVGAIMHAIDDGLRMAGHDSMVVAGYGDPSDADYIMESGLRYRINALESRLRGNDGFGCMSRRPTAALLRRLDEYFPDIIHIHNYHGYYLNLPMLMGWAQGRGVKIVGTLHDFRYLTGRCAYPQQADCNRWQTSACVNCPHHASYPASWFGRKAFSVDPGDFDRIIAPSEFVADRVRPFIPDVTVIGNGIDDRIFTPQRRRVGNSTLKLLAVANKWLPYKGLDSFIRLAESMPSFWSLTIVGEAPDVRKDNMIFVGKITDPHKLASLYAEHDVTLSASYAETFGMTVAESIMCARPVVVRAETAPASWIMPEEGVTADFDDIPSLIEKIRCVARFAVSPSERLRASSMARQYIDVYREISPGVI